MTKKIVFALAPLALFSTGYASQTFVTASGSTDSVGEIVSGKAIFTVNDAAGTVTINLYNLLAANQEHSAGQGISGISFTLSGAGFGAATNNNTGAADQKIQIPNTTTVTLDGTTSTLGWGLSGTNGTYKEDDLSGGSSPAMTLVGGTAGSTLPYSISDASLHGNHNPFIQGEADWVLHIANLSSTSGNVYVTGATFSFGTSAGDDIHGAPSGSPEPFTLGLGIAGVGVFLRRRMKTRSV